jgi:hypothetical protein
LPGKNSDGPILLDQESIGKTKKPMLRNPWGINGGPTGIEPGICYSHCFAKTRILLLNKGCNRCFIVFARRDDSEAMQTLFVWNCLEIILPFILVCGCRNSQFMQADRLIKHLHPLNASFQTSACGWRMG